MNCMNFQIMIQALIKSFGLSTDKRIEENLYKAFRYYLCSVVNKCFRDDYRHGKMIRTELLINTKKTLHKTGSSAITNIALEREEKK